MKPGCLSANELKLSAHYLCICYSKIALYPMSYVVKMLVAKVLEAKLSAAKMLMAEIPDVGR